MATKNFDDYHVEDFVSDESFVNYWLNKNSRDRMFWEEWLAQHPAKASEAAEAKQLLEMLSLRLPEAEYKEELEKIKAITSATMPDSKPLAVRHLLGTGNVTFKIKRKKIFRYAVPLTLILLVGGYFTLQSLKSEGTDSKEISNKGNAPMTVTLTDNTVVTLGPHSSLHYPKAFTGINRDVYLEGEAFFKVTHDKAHPFKVYEDDVTTTVLGTEFHVKKDFQNSTITVELLKGSVIVDAPSTKGVAAQSVILNPSERVVYNQNDNAFHKELIFVSTRRAGRMQFKYDDFNTIAGKFKDAYGVTVVNKSKNTNWRFNGEFENVTANELIENICLAKNLHYEFQGDTIIVK